jgi:hypothetical protein
MNDDERTVAALRVALDERAAEIEPADRLDEILERTRPPRAGGANRSWMLLAAAAAVLAVVAGLWLGLPDGSEPVPGGTDRPLPSASPSVGPTATDQPVPSSTAPTPSPTTTTAAALAALPVYYVAPIGDDARMARLYREWLTVPGVTRDADDQARARAAVELAMTAVPAGTDGYLRTWDGVDLLDVTVTDGRITITLSGPGTTAFPEDTERVTVQQLVWTAQAAVGKGTIPVRFELADGSDAMFGTQPVDRTYNRPPSRDLYHEDLAPIWVTAPTRGQVLPADRAVTVRGEACVFEATVSWELLRDGDVVDEGFVTASVGAPGRGTYEIGLGSLVPGSYAVRVFELSAEDGRKVSAETTMPFTVR